MTTILADALNESAKTQHTGEIMTENPVKQSTVVQTATKTTTSVEFMVIDSYTPFNSSKRNTNTLDVPCWTRIGYQIKPLILMVYGDENIQQVLKLEPFGVYASELDIKVKSFQDRGFLIRELESGKKLGQLSRENNIHPNMISRWKLEYDKDPGSLQGKWE